MTKQNYNEYAWIILRNGKGKKILCSYNEKTKRAFYLNEYGEESDIEIFNFVYERSAYPEEINF